MAALTLHAQYDNEASVYYAESPDLPGLVVEALTLDALQVEARLAAQELLGDTETASTP